MRMDTHRPVIPGVFFFFFFMVSFGKMIEHQNIKHTDTISILLAQNQPIDPSIVQIADISTVHS